MNDLDFPKLISKHFNKDEIKTIGFRLGIDHEEADSESKQTKINYLIQQCQKQNKLDDLLEICIAERSHVTWPALTELRITENSDLLAHPHVLIYKEWVVKQYNVMRLLSMARPLPLDAVYTDVYLLNKNHYRQNDDQASARLEAFSRRERGVFDERHPGVGMLEIEKHLFIVGQPGAGKTTFLKWLAVRAAQDELDLKKIPILVELRRLNDGQYSLFELIAKEWLDSGFPKALATDYVEQLIRSGNVLVLLDGLDEVRQDLRERVNNQIDDLLKMSDDSHVVITCRPHAENRQFEIFTYMEMAEFTPEQTNQFIQNWFGDEKAANKLIEELENREQKPIQELTKIPLLLALICISYDQVGELPQRRADLYSHALEIVLSKWDNERGVKRDSTYGQLTTERKEALLAHVAYHSFEAGQLFISQKELEKLVSDFWQEWRQEEIAQQKGEYGQIVPEELPRKDIKPQQIITEIMAQHGLIVEQVNKVYSFVHFTIQEYFTSKYVANNVNQSRFKRLLTHVIDDQWNEIFLLAVSLLDDADEFFDLFDRYLATISRQDEMLSTLLAWGEMKAEQAVHIKGLPYRVTALRGWYLSRAVDHARALEARARNARSRTLLLRPGAFESALSSVCNRTLACAYALDLALSHVVYFDRALSNALNYARSFRRSRAFDHANFRVRRLDQLDRALADTLDHAQDLGLEDIYTGLANLVSPKIEDSDEVWQQLATDLSEIIGQYRDLSGLKHLRKLSDVDEQMIAALDWTSEGIQAYIDYLTATRLLVDCLTVAIVYDRSAIEDQLLLLPKLNEDEKLEKK